MILSRVIRLMLVIVAIIHLIPLSGVMGSERLAVLYGISFDDPNITILMRHRAVLFGLLGLFFLYAAFHRTVQLAALIVGLISVTSFLIIAWSAGGYNSEIARVFTADIAALVCLLVGLALFAMQRKTEI